MPQLYRGGVGLAIVLVSFAPLALVTKLKAGDGSNLEAERQHELRRPFGIDGLTP